MNSIYLLLLLYSKRILRFCNIGKKRKKSLTIIFIFFGKIFLYISFIIAIEKPLFSGELRNNIISKEVINKLEIQGFLDGYQRSKSGLDEFIEGGIQKRNIMEIIEHKIYADAYLRGYLQFETDLSRYITMNKSEMYLQAIGFKDGCLRAKARLNKFPGVGMDNLGLTKLRQQLIYIDAYQRGYYRWLFTNSCLPTPYN